MNCTDDTSDSMINLYKGDGKHVKLDAASSTFNLPFFTLISGLLTTFYRRIVRVTLRSGRPYD